MSNKVLHSLRYWQTNILPSCRLLLWRIEATLTVLIRDDGHSLFEKCVFSRPSALCPHLNFKFVKTVELTAWTGRGLHHMQQSWMLAQAFPLSQALSPFSYYLLQDNYFSVPCPLLPHLHFHSLSFFFISYSLLLLFLLIIPPLLYPQPPWYSILHSSLQLLY